MRARRYRIFLALFTVVMILLAIIAESFYFSDFEYRFRTKMFNKTLVAKEIVMGNCLEAMKPILANDAHHGSSTENNLFSIAEENNITILEYMDNKLVFWSDNEFDVPLFLDDSLFSKPLVFLQNGWFLVKTVQAVNEKIVGLLRLHTDYGFENDIIRSGFEKDFMMPDGAGFSLDEDNSEFKVFDKAGEFLFSLTFPEVRENSWFILIPLLIWAVVFLMVIMLSLELVRLLVEKGLKSLAAGFVFLIFTIIYISILLSGKPYVFFQTELFSPFRFSLNKFIPSLGHLFLLSILASIFSIVIYKHYPFRALNSGNNYVKYLSISLMLSVGALLTLIFHFIFTELIYISNINFETYKILEINIFSIGGFISVILLLLVPVIFLLKVFQSTKGTVTNFLILTFLPSVVILLLLCFCYPETMITPAIFYMVLTLVIWILVKRDTGLFNASVILSLIFGIYSLYFITILSEEKTNRKS